MTLRLGQMLHRERTEIAQGRHRGPVINLARVTVAKPNCCTDCLASLSSTVFMYAPVAIAALDIQRAAQASFALTLYMPEGSMKLRGGEGGKRKLFCFTIKIP